MNMTEAQSIKWDNDPHAEARTAAQVQYSNELYFRVLRGKGETPNLPEMKILFDQWLKANPQ